MKDNSLLRLGGTCAILLGIAKLLASIAYFFLPVEQRAGMPGGVLLPSVAQGATVLYAIFWLEASVGVLGVAVVPAVSQWVRSANEGWVRWTSSLALAGFVIVSVGYLLNIARLPGIAAAYAAGDATTKAAILPLWKSSIDLQGIWGYGMIGVWVLVASLLAMRGATALPRALNYVGLALAVLYILVPFAVIFKIQELILFIVAAGAIAAPIWYVWVGMQLRRAT